MDQLKGAINQVFSVMEQNNRGVQLGCYSVALVGLTIAIRRVRPFSRFKKPSDIPNHFIRERRELTGIVERIDPNGALLMVQHKPLIALPIVPVGQLPVKISGVQVSGLGLNWLQAIVTGNEVKFVPIAKNKDFVQCEVLMTQKTHDKKPQIINIGESLVRIGFGQVADVSSVPQSIKSTDNLSYFKHLKQAENYYLRKKLGARYYLQFFLNAGKKLNKLITTSSRRVTKLPKLTAS